MPAFTYAGQTDPFDAVPDGPANWQDNVTRADGTGEVTIQLFTKRESAALGCDATAPCSIVVVPNYGRPEGCDRGPARRARGRGRDGPSSRCRSCPSTNACPLSGDALRVEGSPIASDLLATLARQDLHAGLERRDPRLHRDRRAADPRGRGLRRRPTSAWSSTRSTRTPPRAAASSTPRSA